jgi:hypothetical protein
MTHLDSVPVELSIFLVVFRPSWYLRLKKERPTDGAKQLTLDPERKPFHLQPARLGPSSEAVRLLPSEPLLSTSQSLLCGLFFERDIVTDNYWRR